MTDASEAKKLNVFITDATSGVGRALTKTLAARGHKVVGTTSEGTAGANVIRNDGGIPVYPDLLRLSELKSLMQMLKADVVVHLAPLALNQLPHYDVDESAAATLLGEGVNVVAEAAGWVNASKLIYPSFAYLYGDTHGQWVDEKAHLSHDYPLFEAAAHAESAILDGGVPGYVLRAGHVYGGYSHGSAAVGKALQTGQSLPAGPGVTSFIHEQDLAAAIVAVAEADASGETAHVFNVADDNPVSCDTLLEQMASVMGVDRPGTAGDLRERLFQPDSLRKALLNQSLKVKSDLFKETFGWTAKLNHTEGIEQTLLVWRAGEAVTL